MHRNIPRALHQTLHASAQGVQNIALNCLPAAPELRCLLAHIAEGSPIREQTFSAALDTCWFFLAPVPAVVRNAAVSPGKRTACQQRPASAIAATDRIPVRKAPRIQTGGGTEQMQCMHGSRLHPACSGHSDRQPFGNPLCMFSRPARPQDLREATGPDRGAQKKEVRAGFRGAGYAVASCSEQRQPWNRCGHILLSLFQAVPPLHADCHSDQKSSGPVSSTLP